MLFRAPTLLLFPSRNNAVASKPAVPARSRLHIANEHMHLDKYKCQPNEHHRLSNRMRLRRVHSFRFAANFFIQPLSLGSPSPRDTSLSPYATMQVYATRYSDLFDKGG
jgi:hypothetical protein